MSDTDSNTQSTASKYELINAYDEIVKTSVRQLMQQSEICQCEKCFLDVCAMVFNDPSRNYTFFVTTDKGRLIMKLSEMEPHKKANMIVAIMAAIEKVRKSPQH